MVKRSFTIASLFFFISTGSPAQTDIAAMREGFLHPPLSARPRTWWHWTQSNVSKEGITKDLEWMKRVGLAGMQLSDVAAGGGQTVTTKLLFGSPEWLDAVQFSAAEAKRLGLEMSIFSSAGWSLTGGPWVKPSEAMKKLVWSEMNITGGTTFNGILPAPPNVPGAIRNLSAPRAAPGFYADFAVIAFKTPPDELSQHENVPGITSNTGPIDAAPLLDDDLNSATAVSTGGKPGTVWIEFKYSKPFTAQALTIACRRGIPVGSVKASMDGIHYHELCELPGKSGYRGSTVRTYSFPETTASFFRVELTAAPLRPADVISEATTAPDSAYQLSELKFYSGSRVNRWEDKAGFNFLFEYGSVATPNASHAIAKNDIIDLTSNMDTSGRLTWNVPPGNWTIMRFGYSLTGAKNRPAVPSGLGYEADKMSRKHIESYLTGYTEPLKKALGNLYGNSLQYVMLDSWEAGIQNWTDEMLAEFEKRRGYDAKWLLPALAGHVMGSADISDRFLWDFRRTLVDLIAENHYGAIADYLHRQGIKTYGEAGGVSLESIEDALLNKKFMDIPMGEFWVKDLHPSSMYYQDVRGAASAGHIYGKNIIAAESFTGGNYESPFTLKKISDYWFTQGINRLVFHTSAHQPLDTKPGNTMVGTHFNRNITWAELATPFITYLSRNAYLLQKGHYVADIAYLLNEGAPSTMPFWGAGMQPGCPVGYSFDYMNADALNHLGTSDTSGKMLLAGNMRYSVLVLPPNNEMTLPVLKKIKELVNNGLTLVGPKPLHTPGLTGYPAAEQELTDIASELWSDLDGVSRTRHKYGKGNVIWGLPMDAVMALARVSPDVENSQPLDGSLSWIHRADGGTDIYFLANRSDQPQDVEARFRISGREPVLWYADNGRSEKVSYRMQDGKTIIPLHFEMNESLFVIFDKTTTVTSFSFPRHEYKNIFRLPGGWDITFPERSGAPSKLHLDSLSAWTASADTGVKYFSGTAVYAKTFDMAKEYPAAGQPAYLDLGRVGDIAEVMLNGVIIDTLWKAPYRADISKALRKGKNVLQVKVTNEWTNRLIGDREAPADKKILSSYTNPFGGQYRLAESGLLGPVIIQTRVEKK